MQQDGVNKTLQTINLIKQRRHILKTNTKYKTESVTEGSGKQVKRGHFPFRHVAFISHIFPANGVRNHCYFSHIMATVKPENEHKHYNQLMDGYLCNYQCYLTTQEPTIFFSQFSLGHQSCYQLSWTHCGHHFSEETHVLNAFNLNKAPAS